MTEQSTSSASASSAAAADRSSADRSSAADRSDDADDLPEQMRVRREKRQRLLDAGRDPYPVAVARTHTLAEVRAAFDGLEAGTSTGTVVGVTGRVVFVRNTGKLCFATLQEGDGTRLQVMLSLAEVGECSSAWPPGSPTSTSATTCSCPAR